MNENKPAWERKLDRDFVWKKIWIVLMILGIAGILLLLAYHIPLVTDYDKTFTGYELHYDTESDPNFEEPAVHKESTVRFDGKLYRYLFKQDCFKGLVYVDDFSTSQITEYNMDDTVEIEFSKGNLTLSWMTSLFGVKILRGTDERLLEAYAKFDRKNEFFCFSVFEQTRSGGWSSSTNYIIVPAGSPEDAEQSFRDNVIRKWNVRMRTSARI